MVDKILDLIESRGMTQSQLESAARLSHNRIAVLKAKGKLRADEAFRIARALNVTSDYLLDEAAESPVPERSDEEAKILWLARQLTFEVAIRRLIDATVITSPVPTIEERKKERLPQGRKPNGSRRNGA